MANPPAHTEPAESPRGWIIGLIFAIVFSLAGAGAVAASSGRDDTHSEGTGHDDDSGDSSDDKSKDHGEEGDG